MGAAAAAVVTGAVIVQSRSFVTHSEAPAVKKHRVVVIGGGTGGCSVAAQLIMRTNEVSVSIIEPRQTHYYQPMWTMVSQPMRMPGSHQRILSLRQCCDPVVGSERNFRISAQDVGAKSVPACCNYDIFRGVWEGVVKRRSRAVRICRLAATWDSRFLTRPSPWATCSPRARLGCRIASRRFNPKRI